MKRKVFYSFHFDNDVMRVPGKGIPKWMKANCRK